MGTRRLHPGQELTKSKPEASVTASEYFLSLRNFADTQKYALRARDADPSHPAPPRLLSIASVLSAPTIWGTRPDYYTILNLARFESNAARIHASFENLTSILNPNTNRYPFASEAFDAVIKAWSVLSNPTGKARFDEEWRRFLVGGGSGTFWTMCPYCYHLYEYEKVYEECCLRCSNERCCRAFHAVAIAAPPPTPEMVEKGYYFCQGFVPFGCGGNGGDDNGGNLWNPFKPLQLGFASNESPAKEDDCNGEEYIIDISDDEVVVQDHGNGKKRKVGGVEENGFMGNDLFNVDVNGFSETAVGGKRCDGADSGVEFFEADDDVMVGFQCDVDLED